MTPARPSSHRRVRAPRPGIALALAGLVGVAASVAIGTDSFAATGTQVTGATLFDADRDRPVGPLSDGATVDLAARAISVRADTVPATVGSVRFDLDGRPVRTENFAPYTIAGDADGGRDLLPFTPPSGSHTLVMTPFSGAGATGSAGTPLQVRFTVTAGTPSPTPVRATAAPAAPAPAPQSGGPTTPARDSTGLPPTTGRYLYVAGNGDDGRAGTSPTTAFRTIARAAFETRPGDTVLVSDGTYTEPNVDFSVVNIDHGGTPGHPITFAAMPGTKPLIKVRNWTAFTVSAPYVTIQGFTIQGNRDEISMTEALAAKGNLDNPRLEGGGINVNPVAGKPGPHHVIIRDNVVSKCGGGGISTVQADYVTIENNTVFGNANWSPFANSGISTYQNVNSDSSTGVKMIMRGNVVFGNRNFVPFAFGNGTDITDGNGIIVDDTRNTQDFIGGRGSPYTGRTLIENNVVHDNGGRGIHVFSSDHVDIVTNTAFHDAQTPGIDGELTAIEASDVRMIGNVAVPGPNRNAVVVSSAGNVTQERNFTGTDTKFVDAAGGDFTLASGSPAIDAAGGPPVPATDIRGAARSKGRGPDAGAVESG